MYNLALTGGPLKAVCALKIQSCWRGFRLSVFHSWLEKRTQWIKAVRTLTFSFLWGKVLLQAYCWRFSGWLRGQRLTPPPSSEWAALSLLELRGDHFCECPMEGWPTAMTLNHSLSEQGKHTERLASTSLFLSVVWVLPIVMNFQRSVCPPVTFHGHHCAVLI